MGDGSVQALASHDEQGPRVLFAGGSFSDAFDSGDSYVVRWSCEDESAPRLDCPPSLGVIDRDANDLGEVVTFTVTASDDVDPSPLVVCVPPSGSFFPRGTTLVTCTATDASGKQDICQFPVTVTYRARRGQR
jgi:hypothetical protein